jgi:integrase
MKMQKPHDVPLSEQALRLLGDQIGGRGKNPYILRVGHVSRCRRCRWLCC